jgi:hypothetical protein
MANDLGAVQRFLRSLVAERHPEAGLFAMKPESDTAEAGVRAGDTVVYAGVAPRDGQAVVWSTNDGRLQVGRLQAGGRVACNGATLRPGKIRGVVVADIETE